MRLSSGVYTNIMEEWEVIVERYEYVERKSFLKACECAHQVLKDDLAPSEIVWFLDTLLLEPVNILKTIAAKCKEPVWLETIGKTFKLLSNVIEKFPEECTQHFENIVRLCEKSFEPRPRAFALQCLTSLVPYCEAAAKNYNKHLISLMNENICKAALAELIGAICAHHPDEVKSNVATIWRVYLNLLDSKHSDTVVRSLLLGVSGVLKSFGNDLDIKEFPVFYKHLIESGEKSKCREVYLTILAKHADLFRELLANDPKTRMSLWHSYPASDPQGVNRQAILSVYNAIKQVFTENQCRYEEIVKTEICQFEKCNNSELKYTALRVLYALDTRNARVYCDMRALHALRHQRLTYEHCEMIQWCLEYNLENDIKLLKNVLVFYEHIPVKYQKELTVDIILRAPPSVRKMAVVFLTNETCQCYKENGNIEKYQQIWKSIFDVNSDDIKNKSNEVFLDFMEYLYQSLIENDEKNIEELSDKLSYLIIISSYIIPLGGEMVGERVCDVSRGVLRLLRGVRGVGGSGLRAARMLLRYAVDVYADIVKDIPLEDCIDESTLYETCLGLVLTAARITDVTRVLQGLKIILFRSDVEASILSRCINTLDNLMSTRKDELNEDLLNKIMSRLEKIQNLVYKGKDGRCLRRELFMFLGKYGRNINKDEDSLECIHLEKYMNLGIPFINEGIVIKVNLHQIHSLALRYEDTKMLQVLHELLYANLWDRVPHENVRKALCYSACVLRVRPQLRTRILTVCGDTALDVLLQVSHICQL
ncbi:hypothetical protein RR48_01267 [Papilio machaon]|uniref:Uncharacterized protein n=1 Tax=Papilio machaon TaxID=76193 RepID=A0A0N1IC28_PAPMA|nr:hypothetical protein RR48_01267 [Papilio machaon]